MSTKAYWVTAILLDEVNQRPMSLAIGDYVSSIKEAKDIIQCARKSYTVYSAWVDTYDKNKGRVTVFHECYVNALGVVETII